MHPCPTCGQPFPDAAWRYSVDAASIIVSGSIIQLTPLESALFGMLARYPGRIVHKDNLINAIYDGDEPRDAMNSLDVLLCKLRAKIKGTLLAIVTHYEHGVSLVVNNGVGNDAR